MKNVMIPLIIKIRNIVFQPVTHQVDYRIDFQLMNRMEHQVYNKSLEQVRFQLFGRISDQVKKQTNNL
jgi:hypothetical protein